MDKEQSATKEKEKKKKKVAQAKPRSRTKYVLLAVLIGITCFVGGFFTQRFILDEELRLLIRVKDKIQKEYYQEITDAAF